MQHAKLDKSKHPLLYMYSERDHMIPYTFVQALIANHRRVTPARAVKAENFGQAPHCAGFKKEPERYFTAVKDFVIHCCSSQ